MGVDIYRGRCWRDALLFNVDVLYRESSLDEFRVESMKGSTAKDRNNFIKFALNLQNNFVQKNKYVPDCFCNRSRRLLPYKNVTGEPL